MKPDPLAALHAELTRSPCGLDVTRVGAELRVHAAGQTTPWKVTVESGNVVVRSDQGKPVTAGGAAWPPGVLARVVQRLVHAGGRIGTAAPTVTPPGSPGASVVPSAGIDSSATPVFDPEPTALAVGVRDNGRRPAPDASKKEPGGLAVSYLGGFASHSARLLGGGYWTVRLDADAIRVFWGSQKGSLTGTYRWSLVREEAWETVGAVRFATAQGARANIPALALFGVLGLAASGDPGAFLSVTYPDGDVLFRTGAPAPVLRMQLEKIVVRTPQLASVLTFDGESLGVGLTTSEPRIDAGAASVIHRIRELGELHAAGLLTDEEFTTKKRDLLDRI